MRAMSRCHNAVRPAASNGARLKTGSAGTSDSQHGEAGRKKVRPAYLPRAGEGVLAYSHNFTAIVRRKTEEVEEHFENLAAARAWVVEQKKERKDIVSVRVLATCSRSNCPDDVFEVDLAQVEADEREEARFDARWQEEQAQQLARKERIAANHAAALVRPPGGPYFCNIEEDAKGNPRKKARPVSFSESALALVKELEAKAIPFELDFGDDGDGTGTISTCRFDADIHTGHCTGPDLDEHAKQGWCGFGFFDQVERKKVIEAAKDDVADLEEKESERENGLSDDDQQALEDAQTLVDEGEDTLNGLDCTCGPKVQAEHVPYQSSPEEYYERAVEALKWAEGHYAEHRRKVDEFRKHPPTIDDAPKGAGWGAKRRAAWLAKALTQGEAAVGEEASALDWLYSNLANLAERKAALSAKASTRTDRLAPQCIDVQSSTIGG